MRINLSLDQISGRNPRDVSRMMRALGIDPARPYKANITFSGVTIEQDLDRELPAV
ncbi:MAG: hypothetical protein IH614_18985 [Desulfuromonadales bacterium]|nr:hypothetical protein [Desulfuromonadales bacterium]